MSGAVFLFPGQGSQSVGMGKDFYDHSPLVRELFERASEVVELDLKSLCFSGPLPVLTQTEIVQPAITLVNLSCFHLLEEEGLAPAATAGHSLGEYAALYAAGAIQFEDVMRLVRYRGTFMKEAAEKYPGGMLAVIGLTLEKLRDICEVVKPIGSVEIANHNSPTQVILTGEQEALKKAAELSKKEGSRLTVPLKVSGPWHSRFMREAQMEMETVLLGCMIQRPSIPVIANVTADASVDPQQIKANLVQQIASPVLWASSMEKLLREGYTTFIEVGPGKVLSGLMRDIRKDATMMNVDNRETLHKLLDLRAQFS